MSLRTVVEAFVREVCSEPDAILTSESVSTAFIAQQERMGWVAQPEECRVGLYIGIQQEVRPLLRRLHPIGAADADTTQEVLDLDVPEVELLQDRYAVPTGRQVEGRPEYAYVPLHLLSRDQMEWRVATYRKLGLHFFRCADVLESFWHRTHEEVA